MDPFNSHYKVFNCMKLLQYEPYNPKFVNINTFLQKGKGNDI